MLKRGHHLSFCSAPAAQGIPWPVPNPIGQFSFYSSEPPEHECKQEDC